jgi:hypothetical protein
MSFGVLTVENRSSTFIVLRVHKSGYQETLT